MNDDNERIEQLNFANIDSLISVVYVTVLLYYQCYHLVVLDYIYFCFFSISSITFSTDWGDKRFEWAMI